MPNELPLPEDIAHLLEKRDSEDRRQSASTDEGDDRQVEGAERRSGRDRRNKIPTEE